MESGSSERGGAGAAARTEDTRANASGKIFYISPQRCGTKSFSQFFRRNGYTAASWNETARNQWPLASLEGRFKDILDSEDFRSHTVFEDGPWYHPPLFKYLYWTFPDARFVYFSRPVEDWLKSMKSHSKGFAPGDPKRHSMVYDRLSDYYALLDAGVEPQLRIEGAEEIYVRAFNNHRLQVRAFFEDKPADRFFAGELYDADKFAKLGKAWGLSFDSSADVHIHKSGAPFARDFANERD
ncbi:sulfotransferase [Rhodobium gokarnense]|uniref:Sulfotransferase family protein n=1 Tax=Rhodobium gokarnense TaxID=364296 RepID=A0ABT3H6F5_9HYPH|nr:sulfotransferase [Rhodobium gokarnense]MCW2305972.1 hypothetical protein [Rhodobium gokarnense]